MSDAPNHTVADAYKLACTRAEQLHDLLDAMVEIDTATGNTKMVSGLAHLAFDLAGQVRSAIHALPAGGVQLARAVAEGSHD